MILPVNNILIEASIIIFGIMSEVISKYSKTAIFGKEGMIYAMLGIG